MKEWEAFLKYEGIFEMLPPSGMDQSLNFVNFSLTINLSVYIYIACYQNHTMPLLWFYCQSFCSSLWEFLLNLTLKRVRFPLNRLTYASAKHWNDCVEKSRCVYSDICQLAIHTSTFAYFAALHDIPFPTFRFSWGFSCFFFLFFLFLIFSYSLHPSAQSPIVGCLCLYLYPFNVCG